MREPVFSTTDAFPSITTCFAESRAFLVRGAIARTTVEALRLRADAVYERWDWMLERAARVPRFAERLSGLISSGHVPIEDLGCDAHLEALASRGYLRELMGAVFDWHRPLTVGNGSFLVRRMLPPPQRRDYAAPTIAWHQDEYFSIVSAPDTPPPPLCFTLWCPLTPCGRDAPGLTVVLGSDAPIIMGAPPEGWPAYIRAAYGEAAVWSPEMQPGDAIAFTSRTIHASHVTPSMTRLRYDIELRAGINGAVAAFAPPAPSAASKRSLGRRVAGRLRRMAKF